MLITYPVNIEYLVDDVRLRVGDIPKKLYSDTVIRSALIAGVKMLQRRWHNRYLVYTDEMLVTPTPAGTPAGYVVVNTPEGTSTIASGFVTGDVFRNPFEIFAGLQSTVIDQQDEWPVILAASVMLANARISSNVDTFQNWSDGEYSFSNVASARALDSMLDRDARLLDEYFKKRLGQPLRGHFPRIWLGI